MTFGDIKRDTQHVQTTTTHDQWGEAIAAGTGGQLEKIRLSVAHDKVHHADGPADTYRQSCVFQSVGQRAFG